jgi:hypothetical protein
VTFDQFLDDPNLGGQFLRPDPSTWRAWRTLARAIEAQPPQVGDRELFLKHAGREWPTAPAREVWIICGRRSGKTVFASLLACYQALFSEYVPQRGERGYAALVSPTRQQSGIARGYASGLFQESGLLADMVTRETLETIELENQTGLLILSSDYKTLRGFSLLGTVVDEGAFVALEGARSAEEVIRAVRPALLASGGLLAVVSSPYSREGVLFETYQRHFGQDGPIIVWKATSREMNPLLDAEAIVAALEADPEGSSAEWLGEFRRDIATFLSREAIEACIVPGRHELPPLPHLRYSAYCDPAGGSGQDSMTVAVGHVDEKSGLRVLDAIREVRPPFDPSVAVEEFAALLKTYRVHSVRGDRYSAQWVVERFREHGIAYEPAGKTTSEIFLEALPAVNAHQVELLDHPRLIAQLTRLERRTSRSGRDSVSHPPGGHDDLAAVGLGVLALAQAPAEINWDSVAVDTGFVSIGEELRALFPEEIH